MIFCNCGKGYSVHLSVDNNTSVEEVERILMINEIESVR